MASSSTSSGNRPAVAGAVEGPGDGDGRALRLGELGDRRAGVDVVAEGDQRAGFAAVRSSRRRKGTSGLQPPVHPEVVRHRHRLDEAEVLVDEAQSGRRWLRSPSPSSNGTSATSATAPSSGWW